MLFSVVDFVVERLKWTQNLPCQERGPGAEDDELLSSLLRVMPLHHQGVGLAWEPYPLGEEEMHQGHHLL